MDYENTTTASSGWEFGLPSSGYGNAGSRIRIDGGVCSKEVEYGQIKHSNAIDYGTMQHDGVDARDVGTKTLVGK